MIFNLMLLQIHPIRERVRAQSEIKIEKFTCATFIGQTLIPGQPTPIALSSLILVQPWIPHQINNSLLITHRYTKW